MKSEKIITSLTELGSELNSSENKKVVLNAILEIARLNDENQSLWDMLEEIKRSEIKNYKSMIEISSAKKILEFIEKRKSHNV